MDSVSHKYFYALRHGHSQAMVEGKIASSPSICVEKYGLTEAGRKQSASAAHDFISIVEDVTQMQKTFSIKIITSDFKRAAETAETFSKTLSVLLMKSKLLSNFKGICPIQVETNILLRERCFGTFEGKVSFCFNVLFLVYQSIPFFLLQCNSRQHFITTYGR